MNANANYFLNFVSCITREHKGSTVAFEALGRNYIYLLNLFRYFAHFYNIRKMTQPFSKINTKNFRIGETCDAVVTCLLSLDSLRLVPRHMKINIGYVLFRTHC
jgi:hypothetical protein